MRKLISIIIFSILLSGCAATKAIVIQKLDNNTALVGYPSSKNMLGLWDYEKRYYVKDDMLKNYADDDEITGYRVEKIQDKTYSYTTNGGYWRTVSCGQLIKN